jgi:hypothetical protein
MKPKSVTLAFKRWFSKAGFGEQTIPIFRFVRSPLFPLEVLFLNPLRFGVASFFIRGLSIEPLAF